MKKIVLSLAGVLAATAFAPEAAAIPAFARQTGMACSACHQQHFPVLNSFGRAFKAGGYTMMGAQGKVEGDHLSVPDTLNLSMLVKLRYVDSGGAANTDHAIDVGAGGTLSTFGSGAGIGTDKSNGQWQFGDEFVILGGGRVAENVGFFTEIGVHGPASGAILRLPFVFDVGSVKLSFVPFTADAGSVHMGYELSSAGVQRANRWSEQRKDTSAIQYTLGDGSGSNAAWGGAATGFAFVAQNDMGYINFTRWTPNFMLGGAGQGVANLGGRQLGLPSADMGSNYFRAALTPTYNDWAFHIGGGLMTGKSELIGGGTAGIAGSAEYDARAHFFDAQAQGKLGGKDVSFYATYAKAPKVSGTCGAAAVASVSPAIGSGGVAATSGCNLFNQNALDKWSWTLGADYSIIPHTLHIGASYRDGRTGNAVAGTQSSTTDKATMVQAIYDFTQNVAFHAIYSSRSGSAYGNTTQGQNETMFMLEAGW